MGSAGQDTQREGDIVRSPCKRKGPTYTRETEERESYSGRSQY